jgi:hypothetical protein
MVNMASALQRERYDGNYHSVKEHILSQISFRLPEIARVSVLQ